MGPGHFDGSRMEVGYCTSGFVATIQRDLHKLLLLHVYHAITYSNMCLILVQTRKETHA